MRVWVNVNIIFFISFSTIRLWTHCGKKFVCGCAHCANVVGPDSKRIFFSSAFSSSSSCSYFIIIFPLNERCGSRLHEPWKFNSLEMSKAEHSYGSVNTVFPRKRGPMLVCTEYADVGILNWQRCRQNVTRIIEILPFTRACYSSDSKLFCRMWVVSRNVQTHRINKRARRRRKWTAEEKKVVSRARQ